MECMCIYFLCDINFWRSSYMEEMQIFWVSNTNSSVIILRGGPVLNKLPDNLRHHIIYRKNNLKLFEPLRIQHIKIASCLLILINSIYTNNWIKMQLNLFSRYVVLDNALVIHLAMSDTVVSWFALNDRSRASISPNA